MAGYEKAQVLQQECIATDIYSLWLSVSFANEVTAGQFVSLFSNDKSRLLPRPISICGADPAKGTIRLVYRIAGKGTREFSELHPGDDVTILGPLGNGFPLDLCAGKRVMLIGGGIGIPPMLACAEALTGSGHTEGIQIVAGYRSETYLLDELRKKAPVSVATDDGSCGIHGTVADVIRAEGFTADVMFACGPKPMLRALKEISKEQGIPLYVSMEERMACGIGACLGCVCRTTAVDGHSRVKNARVCKDGPVFDAREVDFS